MKSALLFFTSFFCLSPVLSAQTQGYYSIFENHKQWELKVLDYVSGITTALTQSVRRDTIIGGQNLFMLQESMLPNAAKVILLKEDVVEKKVYIHEDNKKFLLYDFTLQKGDRFTIEGLKFDVVAVSEIKINDSWRRQIELQCTSKLADNMIWIEGVGSTVSPLYYKNYADPNKNVKVACLFKGANLEYSLSDQPCSRQLFATDGKDGGFDIKLSPNPFSDQILLHINNPGDEKVTIRLIGAAGQELYVETQPNPGQNFEKRIDFPDLEAGIYFLQISTIRHQLTQKVMKY
jgi:hypothetical protein